MLEATDVPGEAPIMIGSVTLVGAHLGAITSVMPFRGQDAEVGEALGGWPEPGRRLVVDDGWLVWSGMGQVLAIGPDVKVAGAATTDQSDAWAAFRLAGEGAEDVLARLSPVDFRARSFSEGAVVRTSMGQMNAVVLRDGDGFVIMVFRSMAGAARSLFERAMDQAAAAR